MEIIRLHDTMSREVRDLSTGRSGTFRLYVCGPTVYGPAHIGNFITFMRTDVLYRMLKLAGYNPFYVRNITDVDDKTILRANEEGVELSTFTQRWTDKFHQDCQLLQLLKPDLEPKATEHIAEQIQMVERLMEKGYAYVGGDGSVYYKVSAFEDYGKLSHFDPEALQTQSTTSSGAVNLSDEYERDAVADFALWKAHKEADGPVHWDSPWGRGRPGWHLECSAMSLKYLGSGFDLHAGGEDLCFPHHENEIAQSEAASGEPFAKHWMHCVHLMVEGKKMSKSLGNFLVLSDLVEKGFHPAEIRLTFLGGHYRQQFNFTMNGLEAARSGLGKLETGIGQLLERVGLDRAQWAGFVSGKTPGDWGNFADAWAALRNDLNTPAALGALYNGLKRATREAVDPQLAQRELEAVGAIIYALGLDLFSRREASGLDTEIPESIQSLAEDRWQAKKARDYSTADRLRSELEAKGWLVLDRPDGFNLTPKP